MQKTFIMQNENDISQLVNFAVDNLKRGSVVLLYGDLGSGKTTFVRYFASRYKIFNTASPSFNIVHIYNSCSAIIAHADFYRLNKKAAEEINIYDYIEKADYTFIEWPYVDIEGELEPYTIASVHFTTDGIVHTAEAKI